MKSTKPFVVISVDVGSTNCSAVVLINGVVHRIQTPFGNVISSCFYKKPDGEIAMGQEAIVLASRNPKALLRSAKKRMGKEMATLLPHCNLVPAECAIAVIKKLNSLAAQQQTEVAEAITNNSLHVIMTIPAEYDEVEKKILLDTAKAHDVAISQFVTESSAPIFLLHHSNPGLLQEGMKIIVIDLGGATYDSTGFEIRNGVPNELFAGRGSRQCGAEQQNALLFQHSCLKNNLNSLLSVCDPETGRFDFSNQELSDQQTSCIFQQLLPLIERLKEKVSPDGPSIEFFEDPDRNLIEISMELAQYQAVCKPYYELVEQTTRDLLSDTEYTFADFDLLVLAGGAAKEFGLDERIRAITGHGPDQFYHIKDHHYAIAAGAAHASKVASLTETRTVQALAIRVKDEQSDQECWKVISLRDQAIPADGLILESANQIFRSHGTLATILLEVGTVNDGVEIPEPDNNGMRLLPLNCAQTHITKNIELDLPAGEHTVRVTYYNDSRMSHLAVGAVGSSQEPVRFGLHEDSDEKPKVVAADWHLIVLADVSGTMSIDDNLGKVQRELKKQFKRWFKANAHLSLVTFGDGVKCLAKKTKQSKTFAKAIDRLEIAGSTPMAEGLLGAKKLIATYPDLRTDVFIYTDGMPDSMDKAKLAAGKLHSVASRVIAVGIGNSPCATYLSAHIASKPEYYREAQTTESDIASEFNAVTDLLINGIEPQPVGAES